MTAFAWLNLGTFGRVGEGSRDVLGDAVSEGGAEVGGIAVASFLDPCEGEADRWERDCDVVPGPFFAINPSFEGPDLGESSVLSIF